MSNPNGRKGSTTERMAAKYLGRFWPDVTRRLREGRRDDQGDIDGVPLTTIQVKYVEQPRLQTWVEDTLRQRDEAGNPLCLLLVRKKYKPVEAWDAYLPGWLVTDLSLNEQEAWTWIRMDLALAVAVLQSLIDKELLRPSLWGRSSPTTTLPSGATVEWRYAPSTANDAPPSPTT